MIRMLALTTLYKFIKHGRPSRQQGARAVVTWTLIALNVISWGVLPFLHLDHVYYDDALELKRLTLHRSRTALIASDHLPLVADFQFKEVER